MAEKQQQNRQQREQASSRDQAPYTSPLPLPAAGLMFGSTSHDRVRTGHGVPATASPSRHPMSDAPSVYRAMMQATSPPARGGQRAVQNDIRGRVFPALGLKIRPNVVRTIPMILPSRGLKGPLMLSRHHGWRGWRGRASAFTG